jgi:hypothetical protein
MKFSELINLFKAGKTTVRSHMKNLIEMAAVDGNFQEAEMTLLKTIAKRNGISENQLMLIKSNPSTVPFEVPTGEKEKFYQLYDLVLMMSIDNQIHPEEQKLCHLFAIKFGYNRNNSVEMIDVIRQNITNGLGHEEAMKRAQILF